jgi:hypothetical protein
MLVATETALCLITPQLSDSITAPLPRNRLYPMHHIYKGNHDLQLKMGGRILANVITGEGGILLGEEITMKR